jgi:hypothetical protein
MRVNGAVLPAERMIVPLFPHVGAAVVVIVRVLLVACHVCKV